MIMLRQGHHTGPSVLDMFLLAATIAAPFLDDELHPQFRTEKYIKSDKEQKIKGTIHSYGHATQMLFQ